MAEKIDEYYLFTRSVHVIPMITLSIEKMNFVLEQLRTLKFMASLIFFFESRRIISLPFEQSSPDHMGSQRQVWVSRSKLPWPLQSGRHCNASLSIWLQSAPFQPFLHMQVPSAQKPWPEQVGWGQSTSSQYFPLYPRTQLHFPFVQCPCPLQSGTSHSSCRREHSFPFQPGLHWHSPFMYSPIVNDG